MENPSDSELKICSKCGRGVEIYKQGRRCVECVKAKISIYNHTRHIRYKTGTIGKLVGRPRLIDTLDEDFVDELIYDFDRLTARNLSIKYNISLGTILLWKRTYRHWSVILFGKD